MCSPFSNFDVISKASITLSSAIVEENENRTKIRAITDLTGGYPRLVLMLYEILEDKPLLDVLKTFNRLLDNLTPYYQHRMADLSPQQQKIIDEIMLSEGIASPTDIARKVGWKQTIVTSQFKRLKDINILQVREGFVNAYLSEVSIEDKGLQSINIYDTPPLLSGLMLSSGVSQPS